MEGFYFNHVGELGAYFRFVRMFKPTDKERLAFMRKMVARKKAKYIRNPKDFISGKNVLNIKKDTDKDG